MSCQRGNASRTRSQKHQNTKVFKNTLHDKSKKTQIINNTKIVHSCDRCKAIIEWKIKYKKYKQLKSPKTCVKCSDKTVKQSYHTICAMCVEKLRICAKCGTSDFKNSASITPDLGLGGITLEDEESDQSEKTDDGNEDL